MNQSAEQTGGGTSRTAAIVGLLLALAAAVAIGAYFIGKATEPSLGDAREKGVEVGTREGKARSGFEAYQAGLERGKKKGSRETYQKAYDRSYDQQLVAAGYPPRPKPEPKPKPEPASTDSDSSSDEPTEFFKSSP